MENYNVDLEMLDFLYDEILSNYDGEDAAEVFDGYDS